jgi:hypothetical protein
MRAAPVGLAILLLLHGCGGAKSTPSEPSTAPMYRAPSNATIPFRLAFENQMTSRFRFDRLVMTLDGGSLLTEQQHDLVRDRVRKGERAQIGVNVTPGDHAIRVMLVFIGDGTGLHGYKFEIRSSRKFTAAPNGEVTLIAYEQNAAAIEERPAVRYAEKGLKAPSPMCSCSCQ